MPPPKKAAKKSAKKAAAKHTPHDDDPKETRRAYEHLGRVAVLHSLLEKPSAKDIAELIRLAQAELASAHFKHAAELLRTAEHLSFGLLHTPNPEKTVTASLLEAITKEFERKRAKAAERWSEDSTHDSTLQAIYTRTLETAQEAFAAGAWRKALELVRGAEALTHVKLHSPKKLAAAAQQPRLDAAHTPARRRP